VYSYRGFRVTEEEFDAEMEKQAKQREKEKETEEKNATPRRTRNAARAAPFDGEILNKTDKYVFCYTIVLPSFLVFDVSVCLSLIHLLSPTCII
jgi:ribosomal protein S25